MYEELFSNYIGPKAENIDYLKKLINDVLDFHASWRKSFFKEDPSLYKETSIVTEKLETELRKFLERSSKSFPYFHPRYAAQMVKDPSIPTILGYLNFMMSNPNNHAYEGGPVTTEMEMEVVDLMLRFTGFKSGWGHLTSGGSLANMEALWAARDFYNDGAVYFSEVSHYSWKRICSILRIDNYREIPVDKNFRMNLNELEAELKRNRAMFVMANLGSTGCGSVDDISSILKLKEKYNFHLHVDAAYGGFTRSLILDENYEIIPSQDAMHVSDFVYRQLELLSEADSVTIDPHKHGLISYGAGAVLFKNEDLRKVVLNTAPYTYHKQDKPNIGMFSLEGSRPGAMAAACYLTYKVLPPNNTGIGKIISQTFASSKRLFELIDNSGKLRNLNKPDLDINCFYYDTPEKEIRHLNEKTLQVYSSLSVESSEPEFIISKFVLPAETGKVVLPEYINPKKENLSSLRTVFIKHWNAADDFYYVRELMKVLERY